jgi:hypothetical protein
MTSLWTSGVLLVQVANALYCRRKRLPCCAFSAACGSLSLVPRRPVGSCIDPPNLSLTVQYVRYGTGRTVESRLDAPLPVP